MQINKEIFDYDQLIIIGPVSSHEVVGFTVGKQMPLSGNGRSRHTPFLSLARHRRNQSHDHREQMDPVRRVVDRIGAMITAPKLCFSIVVESSGNLASRYSESPEKARDTTSELSRKLHIT